MFPPSRSLAFPFPWNNPIMADYRWPDQVSCHLRWWVCVTNQQQPGHIVTAWLTQREAACKSKVRTAAWCRWNPSPLPAPLLRNASPGRCASRESAGASLRSNPAAGWSLTSPTNSTPGRANQPLALWQRKRGCQDEETGVVTAEDHGRRGTHHGEERRVLGALLRRHSRTFSSGRYGYGADGLLVRVSPIPPWASGQLRTLGGGDNVADSKRTGVEEGKMAKRKKSRGQPPRKVPFRDFPGG